MAQPRQDDGKTNCERVIEVLRASDGRWLSASEIAQKAMVDPGSVRMVLYTNKEMFIATRVSAGRVKWQISPRQRFSGALADDDGALVGT